MSTYENAKDEYLTIGSIRFAYRRCGRPSITPLALFNGYRGTMDHWDPALINSLAASRTVLLIDNAGVGLSGGEIPKTFGAWVECYISVIKALGINHVDVMGYSMGGCIAQLTALNAPGLVRRLVLCGTTPSTGPGVLLADLGTFNMIKDAPEGDDEAQRKVFLQAFFTPSEKSQRAGEESWTRMARSRPNRTTHVPKAKAKRQGIAFVNFMDPKEARHGSFDRLSELKLPTLIANGAEDLLLPTENSILLWQKLKHADAELHLYPDSGHGFLFQYAIEFATLVNNFLDRPMQTSSRL